MSDGLTYSESLTAGSRSRLHIRSFLALLLLHALSTAAATPPPPRAGHSPCMRGRQPPPQAAPLHGQTAGAAAGRRHRCRPRPCLARVAGAAAVRSPCLHELQAPPQAAPLPSAGHSCRRRTRPQLHHPRALRADPGRLPVRSAPLRAPPEEREYGRVRGGS